MIGDSECRANQLQHRFRQTSNLAQPPAEHQAMVTANNRNGCLLLSIILLPR
jgi:hypothetical protein